MNTISFRLKKEDEQLVREYASIYNLNLSSFIRETILEKIEEDLKMDEERILEALERSRKEESYHHTEVWKMLGID